MEVFMERQGGNLYFQMDQEIDEELEPPEAQTRNAKRELTSAYRLRKSRARLRARQPLLDDMLL
jgi:hypothetical protein